MSTLPAADTDRAGAVGEWYYPNGTRVPCHTCYGMDFTRFRYKYEVRLSREEVSFTPSLGVYTCQVPNLLTGFFHSATITIREGRW